MFFDTKLMLLAFVYRMDVMQLEVDIQSIT